MPNDEKKSYHVSLFHIISRILPCLKHFAHYKCLPAHTVEQHSSLCLVPFLMTSKVSGLGLTRVGDNLGKHPVRTKLQNMADPIAKRRINEGPFCTNLESRTATFIINVDHAETM